MCLRCFLSDLYFIEKVQAVIGHKSGVVNSFKTKYAYILSISDSCPRIRKIVQSQKISYDAAEIKIALLFDK